MFWIISYAELSQVSVLWIQYPILFLISTSKCVTLSKLSLEGTHYIKTDLPTILVTSDVGVLGALALLKIETGE